MVRDLNGQGGSGNDRLSPQADNDKTCAMRERTE